MPRPKKSSTTLTLSEFDKLSAVITDLLQRTRAALAESEVSRAMVARLESAGFLATGTAKAQPTPTANGGAKRTGTTRPVRRRHHSPIDQAAVVEAVKKAGAAGQNSGQLAKTLGVPTERLRQVLYKLRDAGSLEMVGKLSKAKYVVASAKPVKQAKPSKRSKTAKPAKSRPAANGAAKKAAPPKQSEGAAPAASAS